MLLTSFGFICNSDSANPDDQLLIVNNSPQDVFIYWGGFSPTRDTIGCTIFETRLTQERFYIPSGEQSLFMDDFSTVLREVDDIEIRVYAYKVAAIINVPRCPNSIEALADTIVVRTVDDLNGDDLEVVTIL